MPEAAVTTRPMFTDVDVCNRALTMLGEDPITSVQVPYDVTSGYCHDVYEITVCSELAKFDWSFAKGFAQLSPLADRSLNDWTYCYQLPNDCLEVRRTDIPEDRWEVYDDLVGYDNTPLSLYYTRRSAERFWKAYFVDAVSLLLASPLAVAIQSDRSAAADFAVRGELAMADARVRDYQANPARLLAGDGGISAIRGGNSGFGRMPIRWR